MGSPCPSHEELVAFHVGLLRSPRLDEVADHVDACTRCDALLRELDTAVDPVFQALRDPAARVRLSPDVTRGDPASAIAAQSTDWPVIPGYELLQVLGRGGMGTVYQARHLRLNRLVALKRLHATDDLDLSRARAEAEALARLQHPNIVQIHEVLDHQSRVYLVLEFVEGAPLGTLLHGRPRSARESAALVEALARAIHYAHERGIVHRDLKPANILLSKAQGPKSKVQSPDFGRWTLDLGLWTAKITDFGIAKRLSAAAGQTRQGDIVGTPSYMAPEQAAGQPEQVGPASDVYSLGVILYEMLTGRVPLLGPSTLDTLILVRTEEPVPARRLQPRVPRDLDTICLKCLRKDPAHRYASAAALAEDLRRFLNQEPIRARPTPLWERAGKWARRRPAIASLSLAVLLVSVLGFILVAWQWRRAEATARAEREAKQLARDEGRQAEGLLAESMLSQALTLCERGHLDRGLLELTRALETAQHAQQPGLESAARYNLAAWRPFLIQERAACPHQNWVWAVAVSPDSHMVLTASADGTVKRWDAATGQLLGQPLVHKYPVWAVAFSPDGRRIVTGDGASEGGPGEAVVWDAQSGRPIYPPLPHAHSVSAVQFSPDGKSFLTVSDDATRRWRTSDGQPVSPPLLHSRPAHVIPHLSPRMVARFSPDGRTIATGEEDGTIRLWDATTNRLRIPPLVATGPVLTIAFSPDSRLLASGGFDGAVQRWDVTTGKKHGELLRHHGPVKAVVFSPDGSTLAVGAALAVTSPVTGQRRQVGGEVRLWQVATGLQYGSVLAHPAAVWSVAFSPGGRVLLTGCEDGAARFFVVATGTPIGPPLAHEGTVRDVAFSRDGVFAVTASAGGNNLANARIWTAPSERSVGWPSLEDGDVVGLSFTEDEKTLLTRWANASGCAVDLRSGRATPLPPSFEQPLVLTPLDRQGKMLLVIGQDGVLRLWNAGKWRDLFHAPGGGAPYAVALSSDHRLALLGDTRGVAFLRDTQTGRSLGELRPAQGRIYAAAFSKGNDKVAITSDLRSVTVWDVPSRRLLHHWQFSDTVLGMCFYPDGKRLLLLVGGVAKVRDVDTGRDLGQPLFHQAGAIKTLSFSPDGRTVVIVGADRRAALWDVATGKQFGPTLASAGAEVAAFSPDGRRIAVGRQDGLLAVWDVSKPLHGTVSEIRRDMELLISKRLIE